MACTDEDKSQSMTKLWSEDVDHPSIITRYSRNGIPYQVNHERYAASGGERMRNGFRGYSMSAHETQQNEQDTEEGQKPQHRRRIPVAVSTSCYLESFAF